MIKERAKRERPESKGSSEQREVFSAGNTLASVLKNSSIEVRDLTTFSRALSKTWHDSVRDEIKAMAETKVGTFDNFLPCEIVPVGEDFIMIHGIIHGFIGKGNDHRNNRLVEIVRNYVDRTVRRGDFWFVEEGLEKDFGIADQVQSLKDSERYFEGMVDVDEAVKQGFLKGAVILLNLVKNTALNYLDIYSSATYSQDHEITEMIGAAMDELKTDHRAFLKFVELVNRAKMPEPMDMEVGLVMASKGDLKKLNMLIDRSEYQAKNARKLLSELRDKNDVKRPIVAHIFCGHLHVSQVAYFLKNPDYNVRQSLEMAGKSILVP